MGWSGMKNGELLRRAGGAGFDAMLTMDSGVRYQRHIATLPVGVVIIAAPSNDPDDLAPLIPAIPAALRAMPPRSIARVG